MYVRFNAIIVFFKAFCATQTWPVLFAVAPLEPPPSLFAGCEGDQFHSVLARRQPRVRKSDLVNETRTRSTERTAGLRTVFCLMLNAILVQKPDGAVCLRRR